jgi:hypothetical protein
VDERGLSVGHADGREDHDESLVGASDAGGLGDPGGELQPGQAVAGEDGQLLAADEGVQPVDRGDPCFDELGRVGACDRVDRQAVEVSLGLGHERWPAVDGFAHAVEHPADQVGSDTEARGAGACEHGGRVDVQAPRAAEDLDDHPVALDFEYLAAAACAVGCGDLDQLVVADVFGSFGDDDRSGDVVHGAMLGGVELRHDSCSSSCSNRSLRAAARSAASAGGQSRMRASADAEAGVVACSRDAPRSTAVFMATWVRRMTRSIASCLAGSQ